jgi:hypothetical protein
MGKPDFRPRRPQAPWLRTLAAAGLCTLVACAAPSSSSTPAAAPPSKAGGDVAALESRIDALIGEAACQVDGDCRTIAIGALACGGPQAWRAWSLRQSDGAALEAAVERHRQARLAQIARTGEQSVCIALADPGAVCHLANGVRRCTTPPATVPGGAGTVR